MEIKTKKQQVCKAGEFLVAEIDAKLGGYGLVPNDLEGAIVSSHYFLFGVDESKLDRSFLGYFIKTPSFFEQVAAQGSTNYAAIRPGHVLEYTIPLPPLAEQRRLVERIDALAAKIEEAKRLRDAAALEAGYLIKSAVDREFTLLSMNSRWPRVPLRETAKIARGKFAHRPRNEPRFYGGDYRRSARSGTPRAKDPNVQRGHEEERSHTIQEFVKHGFPWCEMSDSNRKAPDANLLLKPGWLPTAIIVNILAEGDERDNGKIGKKDLITVAEDGQRSTIHLPASFTGMAWEPETIFPLEVIDGQHRLWAFEDFDPGTDFQLPVVAFHGLDRSWQAYLFWSVNITPKRINRSLAFDLYPLLRKQDWLDKFAGHSIYRETRCQELVEALWSHPESPWHERINMLGETSRQLGSEVPMVTQAAWIRSLMASFVKEWAEDGSRIGGLFGAGRSSDELTLPWNRAMQVAFLIFAGRAVCAAVKASKADWAKQLRALEESKLFSDGHDFAFYGKYSLFATDQGIRGLLQTTNDLCYTAAEDLDLHGWDWDTVYSQRNARALAATDEGAVNLALDSLEDTKIGSFLEELGQALSSYDWRTSSTPGLTEEERLKQAVFRGSSGYKEIRHQLLAHVAKATGTVGQLLFPSDDNYISPMTT